MMPWNGTDQGWLTRDLKKFEFKLPKEIPAGQYLMRIEQMSIHQPYRQKEMYFQVRCGGQVPGFLVRCVELTH
jgi:hypothetical protein